MTDRDAVPAIVDHLHGELQSIFGERLRSFGPYGHAAGGPAGMPQRAEQADEGIHTLALVDNLTFEDLVRCARASAAWARRGLAIPLILPRDEFARSLDAFPLEYGEIIATHVTVAGDNPFDGVSVKSEDLRRACEVQAKSHLLHLREGYIEAGGRGAAIARLIADSVAAFRGLLANLARLEGARAESVEALASHAETIGLSGSIVSEIIRIRPSDDLTAADGQRLFPSYLAAVERLARFVDRWTA